MRQNCLFELYSLTCIFFRSPSRFSFPLFTQIFQDLYDASETLDDEKLQLLSVEVAKQSHDAIKKALRKPSKQDVSIASSTNRRENSLREAINIRLANVVEKHGVSHTGNSIHGGSVGSISTNALHLIVKLPDDDGQYDTLLNICAPDLMTNHEQLRRDFIAFKR